MSDPRDFDRRPEYESRAVDRSSNAMWGWIAGLVFLVVVLALVFGTGRDGTKTAGNGMSPSTSSTPSTTGSGSSTPPARNMNPPANPAPASPSPAPDTPSPSTTR